MNQEVLKYKDGSYVVGDTFKGKEYFLEQLEKINGRINKYKTYFDNGTVKDMNVVNAKNQDEINTAFVEYLKTTKESFYKRQLKEYDRIGEERYTYTGSYDFMLTALAKMLNIDKSLLEDSKFIAIDLI